MIIQLQRYDLDIVHLPQADNLPRNFTDICPGFSESSHGYSNLPIRDRKMSEIEKASLSDQSEYFEVYNIGRLAKCTSFMSLRNIRFDL